MKTKSQQQQQLSKMSPNNGKTGFPMSPINAAQSYANHNQNHQQQQRSSNNNHQNQQQQNRHSLQFTQQQHQNFLNNMAIMNNNQNLFHGQLISNINNSNSLNSGVGSQIGSDTAIGNNNLLMFNSQNLNSINGFSTPQQQQMMNTMYNQMNLRRNQDLVKLN